ncbi:MAG: sugar-binding transcriptional regulator [candidate division NC10 bacterium]|nr:sugar-binding transcriptional regulator [candidate division NC10 bacterium]MBI2454951.1 sugar-binding transcriptional regulator [candidate division NC10 bacterium]
MDQRAAHLLVTVADLYYLQDRTQAEIARALRISRPHVSRLLKRARETGIVTISVRPPFGLSTGPAEELGKLFPLRDVRVVSAGGAPLPRVAEAAGSYLASRIQRESVVGVSWGRTVRMIADVVPSDPRRSVEVVPLVGGMGPVGDEIHANEIARRLASRLGGKYYVLNAPALAERANARAMLVRDATVRGILERARKADVAVVGIGGMVASSTLVRVGYLKPDHLRRLRASGAVGDICSRFFGKDGAPCQSPLTDRVVGIELNDLRQLPWVVGAAVGTEKAPAILGALRGGYINVLVTDETTARAVLRLARAQE